MLTKARGRPNTPGGLLLLGTHEFGGVLLDDGMWNYSDPQSKISVTGGELVLAQGTAGDWKPALVMKRGLFRRDGLTLCYCGYKRTAGSYNIVGYKDDNTASLGAASAIFYDNSNRFGFSTDGNLGPAYPTVIDTAYYLLLVLKRAGGYIGYVSTDRLNWVVLWENDTDTTDPIFPLITAYDSGMKFNRLEIIDGWVRPRTVTDTFTRDDSALTMGNAETRQAWTASSGNVNLPVGGISGNKAYIADYNGASLGNLGVESGIADGNVDCDVSVSTAASANIDGLVFRRVDGDNVWNVYLDNANNLIVLRKKVATVITEVSSVALALADGQTVSVRVSLYGSSISVHADGVNKITATDTDLSTATQHGIFSDGTLARFDNFKVRGGYTG